MSKWMWSKLAIRALLEKAGWVHDGHLHAFENLKLHAHICVCVPDSSGNDSSLLASLLWFLFNLIEIIS